MFRNGPLKVMMTHRSPVDQPLFPFSAPHFPPGVSVREAGIRAPGQDLQPQSPTIVTHKHEIGELFWSVHQDRHLVFMLNVIMYLTDWSQVLGEAGALARPGAGGHSSTCWNSVFMNSNPRQTNTVQTFKNHLWYFSKTVVCLLKLLYFKRDSCFVCWYCYIM